MGRPWLVTARLHFRADHKGYGDRKANCDGEVRSACTRVSCVWSIISLFVFFCTFTPYHRWRISACGTRLDVILVVEYVICRGWRKKIAIRIAFLFAASRHHFECQTKT